MDETEIKSVYTNHSRAVKEVYLASKKVALAKADLKTAIARGYADGTISGKNPDERAASAAAALPDLHKALADAEELEAAAKLDAELAKIDVECLRMLMRVEEVKIWQPAELTDFVPGAPGSFTETDDPE